MSLLDFLGISKFSTSVRYSTVLYTRIYEYTVANVQARPPCIGFSNVGCWDNSCVCRRRRTKEGYNSQTNHEKSTIMDHDGCGHLDCRSTFNSLSPSQHPTLSNGRRDFHHLCFGRISRQCFVSPPTIQKLPGETTQIRDETQGSTQKIPHESFGSI